MRKILLGGLILILVSLLGCSVPGDSSSVPTVTPMPTTPIGMEPPPEQPWISPAKVQIGNFYPGATAEWSLKVHNGYQVGRIDYIVTTDVGQTIERLALPKGLKAFDVRNVRKLESSNSEDRLVAKRYDAGTKELEVGGFLENQARTVSVTYEHQQLSTYSVYYKVPNSLGEGYSMPPQEAKDWVLIADASPVLSPFETRDILISVVMPVYTSAPSKWEFWIAVTETTAAMVQTELCSRWQVSMR